ncbi:tyrosine-type recombinase/integrase [Lactiplantibacillus plantarum]|uniref:tyrosine-type recombinase/integrase n=1 Tax=Lactiplantibacillus plantarum TaxID=1590 RepID=UPI000C7EC58A|nr:site-specific integrase [Lactiplantibacillus plantarum]
MTVRNTAAGKYLVDIIIPKNVRDIVNNGESRFRKTVPTEKEAERLEKKFEKQIQAVIETGTDRAMSVKGQMLFKDFYQNEWLPLYKAGATGRIRKIPVKATVSVTENLFRLHLLPMFGKYSLAYLNEHNQMVFEELVILSEKYANIKTVKSYVGQMFETAEMLDYIEVDRIARVLKAVPAPKKKRLQKKREAAGLALTAPELIAWIDAAKADLAKGKLSEKEYLLFILTLNLGDRKSESYGLQWQNVDLENGFVYVLHALGKDKELGPTKGHKKTRIQIQPFVVDLLKSWKKHQANELASIGITRLTGEQFVFTYTDNNGHTNWPLHADYLNYRLNSISKRHPDLAHVYPHKLRHSYATLAKQGGATLKDIQTSLTHSNPETTRIYVNTIDTVDLTTNNFFAARIAEAEANSIAEENRRLDE